MGSRNDGGLSNRPAYRGFFELGVGRGRTDGTGTPVIDDGAWHHLVLVKQPGAANLSDVLMFVDGEPITVVASDRTINTKIGNLIVGHSANNKGFQQYLGLIDDVAVWTREVGEAEVRALFSLGQALRYNASEVEALLGGFVERSDVTIADRLWRYQTGLVGNLGEVVESGGSFSIRLGGDAGMISP